MNKEKILEQIENIRHQIDIDIQAKDNNILIDTGCLIHENINTSHLPKITNVKDEAYGFTYKFINLISGLNITNELICESNTIHHNILNDTENNNFQNSYYYTKLQKLNEYIIYDLKKYVDEMIAVTWLLKQEKIVDNIKYNDIGKYTRDGNTEYTDYHEFTSFLNILNDLDNAYKHSYTNTAKASRIGRDKNYIAVYYVKYGKEIRSPRTIDIELDDLITQFNKFYKYSFKLIEKLGK